MDPVFFSDYVWPNAFWFLTSFVAIISFIYFMLEEKKTRKLISGFIGILFLLLFVFSASNARGNPFIPNYRIRNFGPEIELMQIVQDSKKPIVLYFHADWCTNCSELEELLGRVDFSKALQNTTIVSIDLTEPDAEKYAHEKFHVHGLPAIAVADCKGQLLPGSMLSGLHFPASSLLSLLQHAREVSNKKCRSL